MDFDEFDYMSLDDLREMMRQTVQFGANERDKDFIKRLANAIAEREKTFGKEPACEPATHKNSPDGT